VPPRSGALRSSGSGKITTTRCVITQKSAVLSHSKFTKRALFLQDNAPAHRALATQKKLAYLGCKCLDHPPYSPDLAPSDYHLFPWTEKTIESSPYFCHCDLVGRTTLFLLAPCKS